MYEEEKHLGMQGRCSDERMEEVTGGAAPYQMGYVSWMPTGNGQKQSTWHMQGCNFVPGEIYGCTIIGCGYATDKRGYCALGGCCPRCGGAMTQLSNPVIDPLG